MITVVILCLEFVTPLLVEFILLCRLLAVYSLHLTPLRVFASIFCLLSCLKIARIVVFIKYWARHAQQLVNPLSVSLARLSLKLEWILQTIDNTLYARPLDICSLCAGLFHNTSSPMVASCLLCPDNRSRTRNLVGCRIPVVRRFRTNDSICGRAGSNID